MLHLFCPNHPRQNRDLAHRQSGSGLSFLASGDERLDALLLQTADLSASAAAERIIAAVQQWSASQSDDLTILVCDYLA